MRPMFVLLVSVLLCFGAGARAYAAPAAAGPPAVIPAPTTPRAAMAAARDRVAEGDLDGALQSLAAYVAAHPHEAGPERLLGDLYYRHGDLKKAEQVYKHILSYAPLDKETHNRLGSVYATENKIDAAIREFNRSLPGTDSVPDLVALHLRKGDFAKYKHDRELLVQEYPGDTEAVLELAEIYEEIGQPNRAIQYFDRVLDTQPHLAFALNGLGLALMDEHAYNDAVSEFQLCLLYDYTSYPCESNLGGTYYDMGEYAKAGEVLTQAHRMQPEQPQALVNLGNLADANGDWKRAVSYYVQAMTVYPYSADAYINLGLTYNEHEQYQLAEAALVKGLAVAPLDGRLHFVLGDTYRLLGETAKAESQYQAAATAQYMPPDDQQLARERVAALERETTPAKP